MNITEVRIQLLDQPHSKLCAFASIVIDDCFCVRDLRIINIRGRLVVCMPSRKIAESCPQCHARNRWDAHWCNQCGVALQRRQFASGERFYADVAHPINAACREVISSAVLKEYVASANPMNGVAAPAIASLCEDAPIAVFGEGEVEWIDEED